MFNLKTNKTHILFILTVIFIAATVAGNCQSYSSLGDYEIYSLGNDDQFKPIPRKPKSIFKNTPKNALNADGLVGYFVSETADRLEPDQLILGFKYKFRELTSNKGTSFHSTEDGEVSTFEGNVTWVGKWAEWALTIPLHDWNLNATKTFGGYPKNNTGMGNMRLGWKATYLPDQSYYRFAYGAVMTITTGNPDSMLPTGTKTSDEIKLFGCVTTMETDRAAANLELGTIIDSEGDDDRFIYRLGMAYEATKHASLIGEVAGEVQGGDDKDTLDLVMGIRLAPTEKIKLELVYHKNLRTYREYGWDDQLQIGTTFMW